MHPSEDKGQVDLANAMESALKIWFVHKRRYTEVVRERATAASTPDEPQGVLLVIGRQKHDPQHGGQIRSQVRTWRYGEVPA